MSIIFQHLALPNITIYRAVKLLDVTTCLETRICQRVDQNSGKLSGEKSYHAYTLSCIVNLTFGTTCI